MIEKRQEDRGIASIIIIRGLPIASEQIQIQALEVSTMPQLQAHILNCLSFSAQSGFSLIQPSIQHLSHFCLSSWGL